MRFILALVFVTVATASSIHYIPAATKYYIVKSPAPTTQYHEQDSKGFYSYGYSGDTSAKAEYTSRDGSSKGFYSYVDADGKLQTVKYEAGKKKGFKAAATNLPRAPIDNNAAPLPVKDTPEVQMAKQAHFEAYREAELRAALAPDTQQQQGSASGEVLEEQANANEAQVEAAILQNAREQILALMAKDDEEGDGSNRDMRIGSDDENDNGTIDENNDDVDSLVEDYNEMQQQKNDNADEAGNKMLNAHKQMTTYTVEEQLNEADLPNLRTIYSLEDDKSSSILKLAELNQKSLSYLEPKLGTLQPTTTIESVRVPVNSYYTVLSPKTKYSVVTPTILTTVPRAQVARLGKTLPISLSSSFLSHRINSKSD